MSFLLAVSNAAVSVHSGLGHIVNFPFDCRIGIGTIHGKLLNIGLDRVLSTVIPAGLAGLSGVVAQDDWKKNFKETCLYNLAAGAVLYTCSLTQMFFKPWTGEVFKQTFSRTLLLTFDSLAVYKVFSRGREDAEPIGVLAASLYLVARAFDLFVNFGAVTEGLVRLNPMPLFGNIKTLASWLP